MEQYILSATEPKFKYILFFQFVVSLWLNTFVVQEGSIASAKVNDVGLHPPANCTISTGIFHKPSRDQREKPVSKILPHIIQPSLKLFATQLDEVSNLA
jgi:hypothetical protein